MLWFEFGGCKSCKSCLSDFLIFLNVGDYLEVFWSCRLLFIYNNILGDNLCFFFIFWFVIVFIMFFCFFCRCFFYSYIFGSCISFFGRCRGWWCCVWFVVMVFVFGFIVFGVGVFIFFGKCKEFIIKWFGVRYCNFFFLRIYLLIVWWLDLMMWWEDVVWEWVLVYVNVISC